jgi:hypothetical protein
MKKPTMCRALYAQIPRRSMVAASADSCCAASTEKQPGPEADPNSSVPESARSRQKHRKQAAATDRAG